MDQIKAQWRKTVITDQERTGLTLTINLALDEACSVDGLMLAKRNGLLGLIVNGTMVPCNLHQVSWQDAKIATVYAQLEEFTNAGVNVESISKGALKIGYSVERGLFPDAENPWEKPKKSAKADPDAGQSANPATDAEPAAEPAKKKVGRPRKLESGSSARA
jgi:hypothetical protein